MVKRRRPNEDRKDSDGYCSCVDRISMLPDEILVVILSRLTYNEAIATSILSRRWKYLWTFVARLNFDGTESLFKMRLAKHWDLALEQKSLDFVRWVDHAIALHKNSTVELEVFRVLFNLNNTHARWIDKWLEYAFASNVQALELDLTKDVPWWTRTNDEFYTFPRKFICDSIDFKCLRTMSVNMVNLNGEAIEFFLHNCPLLEELSVCESRNLLSLKIVGPHASFKRLELTSCHMLDSVEIRDANLIHLKYKGKMIHFVLENVPLLASFSVGGFVTHRMQDVISSFSSILPQLETFEIDREEFSRADTKMLYSALKMNCLKHLVVKCSNDKGKSLLPLTKLIDASPCLERFVLVVSDEEARCSKTRCSKRKVRKTVSHCALLKQVEIKGYSGSASNRELVMHLVKNALNLKKIVIDPSIPAETPFQRRVKYAYPSKSRNIQQEEDARALAMKQLTKVVPPRIKLEIIGSMAGLKKDARLPPTKRRRRRANQLFPYSLVYGDGGRLIGFREG